MSSLRNRNLVPAVPYLLASLLPLVLCLFLPGSVAQNTTVIVPPGTHRCINLTSSGVCSAFSSQWQGALPNFLNQDLQDTVEESLETFLTLYSTGCSNAMMHFICTVYYPLCFEVEGDARVFPPCQELCDYVFCSCEDDVLNLGVGWPAQLECSRFESKRAPGSNCFALSDTADFEELQQVTLPEIDNVPYPDVVDRCGSSSPTITGPPGTTTTEPTPTVTGTTLSGCPVSQLAVPNTTAGYTRYQLASHMQCSLDCPATTYFGSESAATYSTIVSVTVLVLGVLGVALSLFTMATFLINRSRFPYPERPLVYLTFCYFVTAASFVVGSSVSLAGTNFACSNGLVLQQLPTGVTEPSSDVQNTCVALSAFLYYGTMAALVWWVVLTFTWFLATALKWAEEAIQKFWLLYHALGWGVPLVKVIFVLGFSKIDGDPLAGICYTGNFDIGAFAGAVFMPSIIFLLLGAVLSIIGVVSLATIIRQVKDDAEQRRKVTRLLIRVIVFSAATVVPNIILQLLHVVAMTQRYQWELHAVCTAAEMEGSSPPKECSEPHQAPSIAFYIIKYFLWVGLSSTSFLWVVSAKTVHSWKVFVVDAVSVFGFVKRQNKPTQTVHPTQTSAPVTSSSHV